MKPLTFDDLTPLDEYAARRAEFVDAHLRYRDRYRRVRVGPKLSLVFENRQTLCFRVQEFLRVARIADRTEVEAHLSWFNSVLPKPGHLQAALIADPDFSIGPEPNRGTIQLVIDATAIPAKLVTARPADRAAGATCWVEFALFAPEKAALADGRRAARVDASFGEYRHASALLTNDMRESLFDDLRESSAKPQAA